MCTYPMPQHRLAPGAPEATAPRVYPATGSRVANEASSLATPARRGTRQTAATLPSLVSKQGIPKMYTHRIDKTP